MHTLSINALQQVVNKYGDNIDHACIRIDESRQDIATEERLIERWRVEREEVEKSIATLECLDIKYAASGEDK